MTNETRRLVLKLARFKNAEDEIRARWNEAASLDAAFDGGEWSATGCERMADREVDEVAQRFGFESGAAADAVNELFGVRSQNVAFLYGFAVEIPA